VRAMYFQLNATPANVRRLRPGKNFLSAFGRVCCRSKSKLRDITTWPLNNQQSNRSYELTYIIHYL
jgi:hypothetical protein